MKTIILMLGIAGMAQFSAIAQAVNKGTTMPTTTQTITPTPGGNSNLNNTGIIPNGYNTNKTTSPNSNYSSHYQQSKSNPTNSTTPSTNSTLTPTYTPSTNTTPFGH